MSLPRLLCTRAKENAELRGARSVLRTAALALVALGLLPAAAQAIPIHSFNALPSSTQAGAHPDVAFSFVTGNRQLAAQDPCACQDARNVTVHLPTGLIGNTHSTPQCDIAHFSADQCPVNSQLAAVQVKVSSAPANNFAVSFLAPVFNLIPYPGVPALLGFKTSLANTPIFEVVSARTESDYGVDVAVSNIDHFVPLNETKQVVWGVPADPVHDNLRFEFGQGIGADILGGSPLLCDENGNTSTDDPATMQEFCPRLRGGAVYAGQNGPVSSNSPEIPFFQNPTTCGEAALSTTLDILGYDESTSEALSPYPATTDCAQLTFNPSQSIAPTTTAADSPSGAEFAPHHPPVREPLRALALRAQSRLRHPARRLHARSQRHQRQDDLLRSPGALWHPRRSPLSRRLQDRFDLGSDPRPPRCPGRLRLPR